MIALAFCITPLKYSLSEQNILSALLTLTSEIQGIAIRLANIHNEIINFRRLQEMYLKLGAFIPNIFVVHDKTQTSGELS